MSVFKTDDSNNIVLENGRFIFLTEAEEVRQLLLHRIKLWKKDWFLARSRGIDYKNNILIKNPDGNIVKSEFKNAILGTKDVVSLKSLDILQDNETREMFITGEILTTYGVITLNQEVI